jgi:hypothetical protein
MYCNVQYTTEVGICKLLDAEDRPYRAQFATMASQGAGSIPISRALIAGWIADGTHLRLGPLQMRNERCPTKRRRNATH